MIFSGSAVIDKDNTTGFGQPRNPAMVAIYTAADKATGEAVPGPRLQHGQRSHLHQVRR